MRILVTELKALLSNVNARSELHGDGERQAAGDLKFTATVPNTFLDQLHPTLRSALFFMDSAQPKDLADQGLEEKQHWPHLRFPNLEAPLKWNDEMSGGQLIIHHGIGGRGSDMVLEDVKVNKLEITPLAGAMVDIDFRIQVHPEEKVRGKLWELIQAEVVISIKPPEAAPI